MKRTTIKDIALAVGVSVSTVSRALNNHPDISDKVKEEVQRAARELNYHANQLAVNLRNSRSGLVALIIPEITMFFFPSVINGMEQVVRQRGYQLLVLQSNDSLEQECANLRTCLDLAVDGVLLSLAAESQNLDHLKDLLDAQIPVVLFDKNVDQAVLDQVIINDFEAARLCTERLVFAGARRVCGLFGHASMNISKQRVAGFTTALQDAGLAPVHIIYGQGMDHVREQIAQCINLQKPDGFFCMSDETIAGLYAALADANGHVQQYSPLVTAISDGHLPVMLSPKVPHVHHSGYELGKLAANCLLQRLGSKNPYAAAPQTYYLPCVFKEVG